MKLSNERKVWLREQLDEFSECHLMNFGDSRGWDVHGDLCDLLDDNAQLEAKNDELIAAVAGMRDKWTPPDEVAKLEVEIEMLKGVAAVVPTTWLDPMLTGPQSVKMDKCDGHQVEQLLYRIRSHVQAYVDALLVGDQEENCD